MTQENKGKVSFSSLPKHVAIIMDGNGRWAQRRGLPRIEGHKRGVETLKKISRHAYRRGIKYLTAYAFSKENWKRPREEVDALFSLLRVYMKTEREELLEKEIRLNVIGDFEDIPEDIRREICELRRLTENYRKMTLTLALSYSARSEIIHAVKEIIRDVQSGLLLSDKLNERVFSRYLYTADLPDPDLLIRTGGEVRLSNFLLWQSAYTELYFTDVLWPDFTEAHFDEALQEYSRRERRFGMTSEQIKKARGYTF